VLLGRLNDKQRDRLAELLSEFTREAAVLLGVFIPLEFALYKKPFTLGVTGATIIGVAALVGFGLLIDVRRKSLR
jgi:ascorbate-specific PTS system EIIC-type component UlaA